jgi:ATP-dependent NAD(P)H-hydrate dehydratase
MTPQDDSASPDMSPVTKELLARVRLMVPPMLEKFHKGAFLRR